jgi:hypothetical protein
MMIPKGTRVALVSIALLLTSCQVATPLPEQPPAAAAILTLTGPGGSRSLTLDEIKSLPATEGWAGTRNRSGKITGPSRYKGVSLTALARLVGGITPVANITVIAKDRYTSTLDYDQATKGDFVTYDPRTGNEIGVKDSVVVVVAYEMAGKRLDETTDGPLKLIVVSEKDNQVVDSHWAVRWVKQIDWRP